MNKKLKFLTKVSLDKKIKTKWFLAANLILAAAIILLLNIDIVIKSFGGDFTYKQEILVIDNTKEAFPSFKKNMDNALDILGINKEVNITLTNDNEEDIKKELEDKILIVLSSKEDDYLTSKVITNKPMNTLDYQSIVQGLTLAKQELAMAKTNIDKDELAKITAPITIEKINLESDKTVGENMDIFMGTIFPTLILPFFMLVMFLVQMIGAEINEEKTTRSMEVIISNVSAETHFFSKILAANMFVVIQGLLLALFAGVGFLIRGVLGNANVGEITNLLNSLITTLKDTGVLDKLIMIIPITLVLMILSFIAYSLVSGILASMTVNIEDFQQIQTPIVLICLVGYYLSIMAGMFEGALFIKVLAYVPFISCLLTPTLLLLGQFSIIDAIISLVLLIAFNYVAIKYGLKIYKVGILNYSNEKIWKKMFKAIKD